MLFNPALIKKLNLNSTRNTLYIKTVFSIFENEKSFIRDIRSGNRILQQNMF